MVSRNQKLRGATAENPPNRVAEMRTARRLSQTQLADQCSMSKSSIARIEAGETGLDLAAMRIIAAALQVKPSELLVDEDVEVRLDNDARSALNGLGAEEVNMVMQAASTIAKLVKRLSPAKGAVTLTGDPKAAVRMADIWNEMDPSERARTLGLIETARGFGQAAPSAALIAAE